MSMAIKLYWFLVMHKNILLFGLSIIAEIVEMFGTSVPKRITKKHTCARSMVAYPRPEGVIIDFVYSYHA